MKPASFYLSFYIYSFFPTDVSSAEISWAEQLAQESKEKIAFYLQKAKEMAKDVKEGSKASCHHNSSLLSQKKESGQKPEKTSPRVLIFVSLSLPRKVLCSLYQEAEEKGSILVMRGLKENSFKKTAEIFKELNISVQIDPLLFQEYDVRVVPTFVSVQNASAKRLQGNVSLAYAQSKMEEAL